MTELAAGIFEICRSGNNASTKILPDHIKDMNIPVGKRKQLLLIWNAVDGFQMTQKKN
jgi:hypothetical protein